MKEEIVISILKENNTGLSITQLVRISGLSRSAVRTVLAKLHGAKKVELRNVGMAKIYSLNQEQIRSYHEKGNIE